MVVTEVRGAAAGERSLRACPGLGPAGRGTADNLARPWNGRPCQVSASSYLMTKDPSAALSRWALWQPPQVPVRVLNCAAASSILPASAAFDTAVAAANPALQRSKASSALCAFQ